MGVSRTRVLLHFPFHRCLLLILSPLKFVVILLSIQSPLLGLPVHYNPYVCYNGFYSI